MKITKATTAGMAVFFVSYLLGSFVAVSFDITEWVSIGRFAVALIGGFASVMVFAFVMETAE